MENINYDPILIKQALDLMTKRSEYNAENGDMSAAYAYYNAATILRFAMEGFEAGMRQFRVDL